MKKQSEEQIVSTLVGGLSHLGLWSPDFLPAIKRAMKNGEQEYSYRLRRLEPDDVTDYRLTLNLDPGSGPLGPGSYEASVRVTPEPEHGTFHGIDTAALAQSFAAVHWDREEALALVADHSHSAVALQLHQLAELLYSHDRKAKEIGEVIAARYLLRSPAEAVLDLSGVKARLERSYRFPITDLATTLPAARARNLLLGASVTTFTEDRIPVWAYMDPEAAPGQRLQYAYEFSAGKLLGNYELRELESPQKVLQLLENLQVGERVPVHRRGEGQDGLLYMQADAKNKILLLYDSDGLPLPLEKYPVREKSMLPLKIPEGRWLDRWPGTANRQARGMKV